MQTNTQLIVLKDYYFISLLNVTFPQISQKDDIIKTTPPKTSNARFFPSSMCAVPEETFQANIDEESTNENYKNLTYKMFQKDNFI